MTLEQERAEFEAWAQNSFELHRHSAGEYSSNFTQTAWAAWQARAALQSQDREDAERYRWVKRHAHPNRGFDEWCLPYVDYVDDNLDAAIDHARRIEENK